MALTAKSAVDLERQKIFEQIRHAIGIKHQVPANLTVNDLLSILRLLELP